MIKLDKDYFYTGNGAGNKSTNKNLSDYCHSVDFEIHLSGALYIHDEEHTFPNIVKIDVLVMYTPYLADIFPDLTYAEYLSVGSQKFYFGNLRKVDLIIFQPQVNHRYELKPIGHNEFVVYNNNKKIHSLIFGE